MNDPTTGKGPLASFPWHTQQRFALASATNAVVVLGGNQSGKSTVGGGIISRLVRREGPVYRRLRHPEGRPLKIWASPHTFEKVRSLWEPLLREGVFVGDVTANESVDYKYVQSPSPVFTWEDEHGGGEVWLKSQDQGFLAFESDAVDLCLFDEEPKDPRIFTSAVQRLATTNGIIVLTFTPLLGISWTHTRFYATTARDEYVQADRVWRRGNDVTVIEMGMADNPEAVAGGGVARIQNDPGMTEAEKGTRLYGKYGYAEGLIFKDFATLAANDPDSPYIIDGLPKGRPYSWILTVDPNKRHGGLLSAIDHEGNYYVVDEHYGEELPDSQHADAYHKILKTWGRESPKGVVDPLLSVFGDPGGAGSQALINLADHGIFGRPVKKDPGSVKASIELVRRAAWIDPNHRHPVTGVMGAPHMYFLRSLKSTWKMAGVEYNESRVMWEARQYRQKDNAPPDTPIKEKDDVVDCLRYLVISRPYAPLPVDTTDADIRKALDRTSRRASQEFDDMVAKANKPKAEKFW